MNDFKEKFNEIRTEKNVKIKDIAEYCGVTQSCISMIKSGVRVPGKDLTAKIEKFFDVEEGTFEKNFVRRVKKIKRISKYNAKKTMVDGILFDSKIESRRYMVLKSMLDKGKISDLALQPEFILQESFVHDGKVARAIKYIADFSYFENGKHVVEDVKGVATQAYSLKKKMFLKKFGKKYDFREITTGRKK